MRCRPQPTAHLSTPEPQRGYPEFPVTKPEQQSCRLSPQAALPARALPAHRSETYPFRMGRCPAWGLQPAVRCPPWQSALCCRARRGTRNRAPASLLLSQTWLHCGQQPRTQTAPSLVCGGSGEAGSTLALQGAPPLGKLPLPCLSLRVLVSETKRKVMLTSEEAAPLQATVLVASLQTHLAHST